ncbi:nuclear transport factor 2 family protein [Dyella caseinilytica]|uniref:Nuclear transport factor 2 family protein n=1 Tax=Dyella caseinilytica TaxID=1849581 RepID=A0ABX7GWB5_9GAMM|nr:nuclear transport factor 2 family protein [Dyella caseinilytica]QRN54772.1 nuclear transport factor 2 family protein [Dyella caseinilytica]GFZ96731.1 hypothetical protein GCM10011408_16460 [Dyella caseinilytica]
MTNKRIISLPIVLATLLLPWIANAELPGICDTAASPTSAPDAVNDTTGQRLIVEERASWNLAIKRNAAAYRALHAPDFFTVDATGVVDRADSEASAMDSNVRFDQCKLSGFDVHFVAEAAALVTYHVKAAGLDHGKAFQLDSYVSSLWMKRDGKWLNVFYQATPVPGQ